MRNQRWLLGAAMAVLTWMPGCVKKPPAGPPVLRVEVNDDLSRVLIEARNARLSAVLGELRTKHGIDVRPNSDADPRINVSIQDVPLEQALDRLMPSGVRYAIRTGDREGTGRETAGGGKKDSKDYQAPSGKPEKGKQRPEEQGGNRKPAMEAVAPRPLPTVNVKAAAEMLAQVPRGGGPKTPVPSQPAPGAGRTVRLSLTMRTGGQVRVNSAALLEGAPPAANRVRGPYLFALRRSNGTIVQTGSFADPLEQHSFRSEDQKHDSTQAQEGIFGISLGESLVRERPESLTIDFYDARGVTLPPVLDERSFQTLIKKAKRVHQTRGEELTRALREAK